PLEGRLAALVVLKSWTRKPRKSPKMSIRRRVVLGCRRWSTACVLVPIQAAPVVLIIFALLLPANARAPAPTATAVQSLYPTAVKAFNAEAVQFLWGVRR